jgi:UDP-N-acetylmuramyl tripeptide synthase
MIAILKTTTCFWRNRFSPIPVLAIQLSVGDAADWGAQQSPLIALLRERWPELPSDIGAAGLVAAVAQQLQLVADVTEPDCGVSKRVPDKTKPTIFFACRDAFSAAISVQLAVEIVNGMLAEGSADAFRQLIEESIEAAEAAGFDQTMRAVLAEADRRRIPWMRAKQNSWDAVIGHGAKRRLIEADSDHGLPSGDTLRIPTAMITGTKGKTTTSLMLQHILAAAGHTVGTANTIGVSVDGREIRHGDLAGVPGALLALRDPTVTEAVLETARGSIVKWGIYPDSCDVAALLNVSAEQIEIDGIETVDEMALLKRKVLDGARRAVVLNAEDFYCAALIPEFRKLHRTILFAMDEHAPPLQEHLKLGGEAVILRGMNGEEHITLLHQAASTDIAMVEEIPATMNGVIRINIANALAASALAIGMGIEASHIKNGLALFTNSPEITHGRFNFLDEFPVRIMLDRAGPIAAMHALADAADRMTAKGKRWVLCSSVGNRPEWHFEKTMAVLAGHFDRYIPYGLEKWRRGRAPGEIQQISANWLMAAGVNANAISMAEDFPAAARIIAREATADDFVVILESDNDVVMDELRAAFAAVRGEQHA